MSDVEHAVGRRDGEADGGRERPLTIGLAELSAIPFFRGLPSWALEYLAERAEEQVLPTGQTILHQYDRVGRVYFLVSGSLQILIRVGSEDLLVSVLREPGGLIGWSAFRPPYRSTASVRCAEPCRLLIVAADVFGDLFRREAALAYQMLRRVAASVADRFENARDLLATPTTPTRWGPIGADEAMTDTILETLAASPFFDGVPDADLAFVAAHSSYLPLDAGDRIFLQGEPATTFYILVSGSVQLSFGVSADGREPAVGPLQTISHTGHPIGWSALVEPYAYRATATAREKTRLITVPRQVLENYCETHPGFGAILMRALLGLIGDRLRAARLRLVAQRYHDDILAIRTLLEGSELPVSSPLHKIPHHLENRLTIEDAVHIVDLLQVDGDAIERELAEDCAEILDQVREELWLYQRLQAIYDAVASAPPTMEAEEVRVRCTREFRTLFAKTRHRIVGLEHLPPDPGHIVIMNHLRNHPDNVLAGDFVLTLDTHFVSSMILFEKYGAAPVRVIRKSRPEEYRHQAYYDRLGYIYVYSGYVDPEAGHGGSEARRRLFLDAAASCLRMDANVVICPEGDSTTTEKSPLRFRPGAFQLAVYHQPEPLIVPVAVANFDKKLTRTTTCAVVHEPFKLSQVVADPSDERALVDFINGDLYPRFAQWVREAADLADAGTAQGASPDA
jgi:CRP-like cAMP-binding protein/1-acyl-sn-glycerol-3-phosphate acyltransferase